MRTAYNRFLVSPRGLLECDEKVPFRFTRNIQSLFGRYGKLGPFLGSMAATLKALKSFEGILILHLSVVMRDELAQWVMSKLEKRSRGSTGSTGSGGAGKSSEFVLQPLVGVLQSFLPPSMFVYLVVAWLFSAPSSLP